VASQHQIIAKGIVCSLGREGANSECNLLNYRQLYLVFAEGL